MAHILTCKRVTLVLGVCVVIHILVLIFIDWRGDMVELERGKTSETINRRRLNFGLRRWSNLDVLVWC